MEKAGSEGNNGPGSRKDLNWTVLFVSDTGKVVRVPAFRRYVITAAVVVAVSMIVALCFCALFITARIDTKKATKELETCRARIKSLVDENDRLLAQLAVLENNDTFGNDTEEQDVDAGASTAAIKGKKGDDTRAAKKTETKKKATDTTVLPVVAIENFRVIQTSDTEATRIEFAVKKTGNLPGYVSGRIFVVLEGKEGDKVRRMVVPPVYMNNGVPAEARRGQYFSIARYKPVTMQTQIDNPGDFENATVYIFSTDGTLIYKSMFPVKIVMAKVAPATPAKAIKPAEPVESAGPSASSAPADTVGGNMPPGALGQ